MGRRGWLRSLVGAVIAVVVAAGHLAAPAAIAVDPTATVLAIDGRVLALPDDQYTGSGADWYVSTTWTRTGGTALAVVITGPLATGLAVGSFDFSPWIPGSGSMMVGYTSCSPGHVDVLQAPVVVGGNVTAFAADWTGCGTGSIRVGSSIPIAALRSDPDNVQFGRQAFGTTQTRPVTYRNVGNQALAMGAAGIGPLQYATGPEDFTVDSTTCAGALAVGATCTVTVAYHATGTHGAILTQAATPAPLGGVVGLTGEGFYPVAPNDALVDALPIGTLPYESYLDVSRATTDRLDPVCDGGHRHTVWYRYHAATDGRLALDTAGSLGSLSPVDTVIGVYEGSPPDGLTLVGCADNRSDVDLTSVLRLPVVAGHDYWVVVGEGQAGDLALLHLAATVPPVDGQAEAAGWAVSPATFYPHLDGYRDTALTSATLAEPMRVSIDVVAAGAPAVVLRHIDLGQRESGYAWRWDGKDAGGARVAAGSYLFRHHDVDLFGNEATHDVPVTVSGKRLAWSTATKSIDGSRYFGRARGSSTARTTVSGTTMILRSGSSWAQAAYRLTLGNAVAYGKVRFEVVGRSTNGRKATIWIWDAQMAEWTFATSIGPARGTWRTPSVSAFEHLNGRYAYGLVEVRNRGGAVNWVIEKARVTYTYAVLK